MSNQPVKYHSLSAQIRDHIVREIILGNITPGEKLIESKYAKEYGISRAPVREAFYLLAMDGLVQRVANKGTIVKGFTLKEARNTLLIRNFLEVLSLKIISDADLFILAQKLEKIATDMKLHTEDTSKYTELNYDFHQEIVAASKSGIINNVYDRLGTILLSMQYLSFGEKDKIKNSLNEHFEIVKCLKLSQRNNAIDILDNHNRNVYQWIVQNINKSRKEES